MNIKNKKRARYYTKFIVEFHGNVNYELFSFISIDLKKIYKELLGHSKIKMIRIINISVSLLYSTKFQK